MGCSRLKKRKKRWILQEESQTIDLLSIQIDKYENVSRGGVINNHGSNVKTASIFSNNVPLIGFHHFFIGWPLIINVTIFSV